MGEQKQMENRGEKCEMEDDGGKVEAMIGWRKERHEEEKEEVNKEKEHKCLEK